MALGASPGAVMRMVLSHGRRLTLIGIVAGIAGALAVSRLLQHTLFEVDATNPLIYFALSVFCCSSPSARRGSRPGVQRGSIP
jgi:ABC-type lipoprotein release transport system permease subunit